MMYNIICFVFQLDDTYDADGAMISGVCAPTMEVDGHAGVKMIHKSSFRSEEEYKKGWLYSR